MKCSEGDPALVVGMRRNELANGDKGRGEEKCGKGNPALSKDKRGRGYRIRKGRVGGKSGGGVGGSSFGGAVARAGAGSGVERAGWVLRA